MAFLLVGDNELQGDASSIVLTHGLSISSGDLVVVYFNVNGTHTVTPSQTWDGSLTDQVTDQTAIQGMYWKIAGASEPSAYTFGLSSVEQFGAFVKVFSSTTDAVIDSALASAYNASLSSGLNTTATNGKTISDNAVSIVGGGKDARGTTEAYATANFGYVGVVGTAGVEQLIGGAHQIFTTGSSSITFVNIETADGNDGRNDKVYSIHASFVEGAAGGGDDLLATDIESASEVSDTAIGQSHVLLATDIESSSEVSDTAIGQSHVLLATDIESSSEVSDTAIGQSHVLLATDIESASEVSSSAVGQAHVLLADGIESASEVSAPSMTGAEAANGWYDGAWHQSPWYGAAWYGTASDSLTASDIESASEVSAPVIGQNHVIFTTDIESASEVSTPIVGQVHVLLATDVESSSEVSVPTLTDIPLTVDPLLAEDIESTSEVSTPVIGQEHILLSVNIESASEVSTPTLTDVPLGVDSLLADDIESVSEASVPVIVQTHIILADDIESLSEVSIPSLVENGVVTIDGASSLVISTNYQSKTLYFNGTNYFTIT